MILKKMFINVIKVIQITLLLIFIKTACLYSENLPLFKSYYGSILAGQIAKYNNENEIASEFYSYASDRNPENKKIFEASLMSLVLSGNVEKALKNLNNFYKNNNFKKSQLANLLKFTNLVKLEKYNEALNFINSNQELLISDKIKPIMQSWLSKDIKNSLKYINNFDYKSDGLVLSDVYLIHLAHINAFYNKKIEAIKVFEELLKIGEVEKIRALYFYHNLLSNKINNPILESFSAKNPYHSFNIYISNKMNGFEIINRKDGLSESLFNIAEILYGQRMYESSIAYCYLSLYLNKQNYINYYLIAQSYQVLGKNIKAVKALKEIPLSSYLGWNAYLKLADLEMNINNFDKAEKLIKKLNTFSPNRVDAFYKLGELKHIEKKYEDAIDHFRTAISLIEKPQKKDWYLFYSRGMSYERSKKWENAEKDFLLALKLSPDQPLVLNYLGYTWIDFGINLDEAENLIKKAVKLRPNDGYFVDSLGWAYYRKGEYKRAVNELEKAVSLVPYDPIINDHLGDALFRAGYKNEAIYQWKRALLYNPDEELKAIIKLKLNKGL